GRRPRPVPAGPAPRVDPGPLRDALTVAAGVATGVMSGLVRLGGAVISTPGIRALGASAQTAIGTTLPAIIPGAASGTLRYVREGLVDGAAVLATTPVGIVAAVGGALLTEVVPRRGAWRAAGTPPRARRPRPSLRAWSPPGSAATSWSPSAIGPTVGRRRCGSQPWARWRASCRACWAS